jgi:outer membrane protein assembly factor BamA
MTRRRGRIDLLLLMLASSIVVTSTSLSAQVGPSPDVTPSDDTTRQVVQEPNPAGIRRWIERRVRSLEDSTGDRERGISITAGTVVSGSGFAGGLGYKHLNAFPHGIGFQIDGRVSFRRYQEYAAAVGFLNARSSTVELDTADRRPGSLFNDTTLKRPGSALYVEARYRHYPQHVYYGGGLASNVADRADYLLSGVSVEGVWQRQFNQTTGMSVRGGLLDLQVGSGTNSTLVNFEDRFVPAAVSGGMSQPRFLTFGAGVVRDTRQQPAAPEDGTFVGIAARRFIAGGAPDLDFTRLALDVRGYVRPFASRGVLAMRGLVASDFTDSGGPTPFYLQQYLGGGDTIRGLRSYRFQDQALFVVTAEYRWRVHRHMEIAPFVDAGNGAPALSRLTLNSLRVSPGIAIRARTNRRTLARLELAKGPEGYRIVVGTGPSF